LKILFIIDHLRSDGAQRALLLLTEGLRGRGHEPVVLSLNGSHDPELAARFRDKGVPVYLAGKRALLLGYGLTRVRWFMRSGRFDRVVTFLFVSDVLGSLLARTVGLKRWISSQRSENSDYALWRQGLARIALWRAKALVFNSRRVRDRFVRGNGWAGHKSWVIPNGVEPVPLTSEVERAETRLALGIEPDRPLIGSVGRLAEAKAYDILLQALALLPDRGTFLLLIGDGEEAERLKAQAEALGLSGRVLFAGHRSDARHLLAALDVYAQPSRFEGLPNALLEAMAAACPIVATPVGGIEELITDGVHGWLVPPEDPQALALALGAALENPAEAGRRGNAARGRAVEEFSVAAMVDRWERVLLDAD